MLRSDKRCSCNDYCNCFLCTCVCRPYTVYLSRLSERAWRISISHFRLASPTTRGVGSGLQPFGILFAFGSVIGRGDVTTGCWFHPLLQVRPASQRGCDRSGHCARNQGASITYVHVCKRAEHIDARVLIHLHV